MFTRKAGGPSEKAFSSASEQRPLPRSKRRRKFIAGNNDKIVSPSTQSDRLHGVTRQSKLRILPKTGHMVHYAMRDAVMEAIYEVAAAPAVL
jgi:pimeloyl-ACP methyl ester carboxylesterase